MRRPMDLTIRMLTRTVNNWIKKNPHRAGYFVKQRWVLTVLPVLSRMRSYHPKEYRP